MRGGALRMLTVLDEHTRECQVLRADRALKSPAVIKLVQPAITQHGAPAFIRSDNGSEFIAHELQAWLAREKIKTISPVPGKMALWRASTGAAAMSASTGSNSGPSRRLASSSRTSASATILGGRTVALVIAAQ